MKTNKIFFLIFIYFMFSALIVNTAYCEYGVKQLNIVIPVEPGGTTDRIVRALSPALSEELGVPVIVVNRKGGGGLIGVKVHLNSDKTDGSYLLYHVQPYLSGSSFAGDYKISDLDYLGINNWSPQSIWVRSDSPYKTVQDLLQAIKADPKKIKQAIIAGGWSMVGSALLNERLGSETKDIPYNSGGKQRLALVSGDVDFIISEFYGTKAGAGESLTPLCIMTDTRIAEFPNVPTLNEALKAMNIQPVPNMSNFRFFGVRKGFKDKYPERFEMLVKALEKANANLEFNDMMNKQDLSVTWMGPDVCTKEMNESHETLSRFKDFWQ